MRTDEKDTQSKILESAKQEFLQKGFLNASLRNIVKNAGVTTGACYRYYDSKEALFSALVEEQANYVLSLYNHTVDTFEKLPGEEQTVQMTDASNACMEKIMDYIYDNYEVFKLLIERSEGTVYADFVHQMVTREVDSTYTYMETLASMGHRVEPINKNVVHMIASGFFAGMFETIVHDMPREEAREYLSQLTRFHTAGWAELLGVTFGK